MLAFPHLMRCPTPHLRSFVVLRAYEPTREGVTIYRRFSHFVYSPCDLLAKPGLLGICVSLTSTFQGQLFHHGFASPRSYAPTAHRLPVQATGLRLCHSSIPS